MDINVVIKILNHVFLKCVSKNRHKVLSFPYYQTTQYKGSCTRQSIFYINMQTNHHMRILCIQSIKATRYVYSTLLIINIDWVKQIFTCGKEIPLCSSEIKCFGSMIVWFNKIFKMRENECILPYKWRPWKYNIASVRWFKGSKIGKQWKMWVTYSWYNN